MANNHNNLSAARLNLAWWEITLIVLGIKSFIAVLLGCRKRNSSETLSEGSSETLSTVV